VVVSRLVWCSEHLVWVCCIVCRGVLALVGLDGLWSAAVGVRVLKGSQDGDWV